MGLSFLLRSTDECEAAIELATCLLDPYPFDKIISEMRHMEGFNFKGKRIENPTAFTLSELVSAIRNDTPSAQKLAQASMSSKRAQETSANEPRNVHATKINYSPQPGRK